MRTEYVIQSGAGFLLKGSMMICDPQDPSAAARDAQKYKSPDDAEYDLGSLRERGMDAELVELKIGEVND